MRLKNRRRLVWLAVPLSLSLMAAACGDDDGGDVEGSGGGGDASGSVNIAGSSTVEPISSIVAEEFSLENEDVEVAVTGEGTGDGFEQFCAGETDISDASRPIEDEEIAACEEAGVEYVELQIGFDGLTVMTNPANDAVECLSLPDLYALLGPESEGFGNWSDAATLAGELGSETELPDASLEISGPGQESGTYDSFIELALTPIAEERGLPEDQVETMRDDYQASAEDPVIIENIAASDTSLGWVGFAFAENAGDEVKELAVAAEANGECIEPSAETIANDSYPLSRSLYIYVNAARAEESSAVSGYVDFYLSDLATWVEESGYVALPEDLAAETASAWESR